MSDARVTVRPMRDEEYAQWRAASMAGYAESMIEHAGWDVERARQKATEDYDELLPDGLATEKHAIFVIEEAGEPAGTVWVAEREWVGRRGLFVYEIEIHEDRRGRGLGRAGMLFVEEEARRRGLPKVELNVFGGNDVARRLYTSLGYRETSVHMEKPV